jgi:general L-amino acid transport system permease protein
MSVNLDAMSATPQEAPAFRRARLWLKKNLFRNAWNTALTLACSAVALLALIGAVRWGIVDAVPVSGTLEECRTASGACWAFLREKWLLILTGTYPPDERWRAFAVCALILLAMGTAAFTRLRLVWKSSWLGLTAIASYLLLRGGVFGLPVVESARWNGLPLVLFLSVFTLAAAFPLGVSLALVRWCARPFFQRAAVLYIEVIRAIPMVAVLFAGVFILPLLMPPGAGIDPVLSILIVLTFFHAAYFAEDVRAGLQALPRGQIEAADSLGLKGWQRIALVVLPQSLRIAMPGVTNTVIGGFKDTSLVAIVGMHDLISTARMAYADPLWQAYALEANIAIGCFYFAACAVISWWGRKAGTTRAAGR